MCITRCVTGAKPGDLKFGNGCLINVSSMYKVAKNWKQKVVTLESIRLRDYAYFGKCKNKNPMLFYFGLALKQGLPRITRIEEFYSCSFM